MVKKVVFFNNFVFSLQSCAVTLLLRLERMDLKIYETSFVERHENTFKLQDLLLTDKNIEGWMENAMVKNDSLGEASVIPDQRFVFLSIQPFCLIEDNNITRIYITLWCYVSILGKDYWMPCHF